MSQRRRAAAMLWWTATSVVLTAVAVRAHSGPPFPIASNQVAGPYRVSIWTDPDATDNGSAAGRFWVMVDPERTDVVLPHDTQVTVSISPKDREGPAINAVAQPIEGQVSRQFVTVLMDHEGPFSVKVTVDSSLGAADFESGVDATYNARPRPVVLFLSLLPFALMGGLWLKLLLKRLEMKTR
jgi:hypothetical protein